MSLAHNPKVVVDGLVGYWDAANTKSYPGSGTVWSDLVGTNHGTLVSESIGTTNPGYMTFDSCSYDYITLSSQAFDSTGSSFSVWINSTGEYSANYSGRGVILSRDAATSNGFWLKNTSVGSNYKVEGETNTNENYFADTPYDYTRDQWLHVHINFSESTGSSYVNGEFIENNALLGDLTTQHKIGGNADDVNLDRR